MFKENTSFNDYIKNNQEVEKESLGNQLKMYGDFCREERINYYKENKYFCIINKSIECYVKAELKKIQMQQLEYIELFKIEDVFFRLIYDIYAGQKFKNIFGKDFIYTNSFNLKSLLDEIDVGDKHFYNHYSIEEFATETGNDINIILAYEVLHNNNYKYMIQEHLNHHFNVYRVGKNEFINN